jgi:hypothetical protein
MKFFLSVLALPAVFAFTGPNPMLQMSTSLKMSSNDYLGNLKQGPGAPPGAPPSSGPVRNRQLLFFYFGSLF